MHPYINNLLNCIGLEEKEQAERYRLDQQHSLKQLKAEGLALHPIIVQKKTFGFADYPEIQFRLAFPPDANMFKDGSAIECFKAGEDAIKGVLISLDGLKGEFRLFAPDFPEWIEEDGVGIKLAPDTRTTGMMKKAVAGMENDKKQGQLFKILQEASAVSTAMAPPAKEEIVQFINQHLNESQQQAVRWVLQNQLIGIIHGPPGTGKTTTLIECIQQLINRGEKIIVSAPSNAAVDNICRGLILKGVNLVRVGNTGKTDATVLPFTPVGKLSLKQVKEIKDLKKQAEEFRRMALQYKRNFGKEDREQRNLLFNEVKKIRNQIRQLERYNEEKMFAEAQVVAGTPVGLQDAAIDKYRFSTLFIDEAGQCIEPLAWVIFPMAEKIVLAGDHLQLPPTVLSQEAVKLGFARSILEVAQSNINGQLLNVQYRMRESIAGFSSQYFYSGKLKTPASLSNEKKHLTFIDTAGTGFNETTGSDGMSLQNEGEMTIAMKLLEDRQLPLNETAFISPYAAQVELAKKMLPPALRSSTIDSFQGQEKEHVILSLVRSNDETEIGFLKDYRRMNVAMTRAKENLFIIADSSTIGADNFYQQLLDYIEKNGQYQSAWEYELW